MSTPSPRVMHLHSRSQQLVCGACGTIFDCKQLHAGRGRHLDEHPQHEYAPCGHSQTWHGNRPVTNRDEWAER